MLVLSRKESETVLIGDDIVLTILSIKGNQIKLGINAPDDVNVVREEIYQKRNIKDE